MKPVSRTSSTSSVARSPSRVVATPEPERRSRLMASFRRGLVAAAVLALLGFLAVKARDFLYESAYFEIRTVVIEGAGADVTAQIQSRLEAEDGPHNLIAASPAKVRAMLLGIPPLRDVTVERRLPDTLVIKAEERYPVAVVVGETNYALDADLVAMGSLERNDFLNSRLPLITIDAPPGIILGKQVDDVRVARSWELLSALRKKAPDLAVKVSETHIGADGEITLHLEGGTELRLGRRPAAQVLPILEGLYADANGLDHLEYAELEYRNQIAIKKRGTPAPGTSASGEPSRGLQSLPSH